MNSKLFAIVASIALAAGAANAAERHSENVTLPDGSIVATVMAGKTGLLQDNATGLVMFHCSPTCAQITPATSFSPGIVASVAKSLSTGLGFWPGLAALRPAVDNSYVSSYSQSQGGNNLNDFGTHYTRIYGTPTTPSPVYCESCKG